MHACLLCNKPTSFLFSAKDFERPGDPSNYEVYWCNRCEFGRLAGDFTPTSIAQFYISTYYTHQVDDQKNRRLTFREKALFHLAWRMDRSRPVMLGNFPAHDSVCDIGCGNGAQLRLFSGHSTKIVGVDPDPAARQAASDAGVIFDGIAERLPETVATGRFDAVLLSHVLEHCISPVAAIRSAKSILSERGTLMIEVPNNDAWAFSETERSVALWFGLSRGTFHFSPRKSLGSLVERQGLRVKLIEVLWLYSAVHAPMVGQASSNMGSHWIGSETQL